MAIPIQNIGTGPCHAPARARPRWTGAICPWRVSGARDRVPLWPVERVEKTGEGLGVLCLGDPAAKVAGHFAHHIGLAGVLPVVEQVVVNAANHKFRVQETR